MTIYLNKMKIFKYRYFFRLLIFFVGITTSILADIHIYFFDVGQGNCVLLRNETNAILVDAGGSSDKFLSLIKNLKNCLGSAKINGIVLTHLDDDHKNFVNKILCDTPERFNSFIGAKNFIFSIMPAIAKDSEAKPSLIYIDNPRNVPSGKVGNLLYGQEEISRIQERLNGLFEEGEGSEGIFKFLVADWASFLRKTEANDTSLVLSFEYCGHKVLFTGDSTGYALDHYIAQNLGDRRNPYFELNRNIIENTSIFVMPHHGSDREKCWRWTLNVVKTSPNLMATIINADPITSPYRHPRVWIRDVIWPPSMISEEAHTICYNWQDGAYTLSVNERLFTTGSLYADHRIEITLSQDGGIKIEEFPKDQPSSRTRRSMPFVGKTLESKKPKKGP